MCTMNKVIRFKFTISIVVAILQSTFYNVGLREIVVHKVTKIFQPFITSRHTVVKRTVFIIKTDYIFFRSVRIAHRLSSSFTTGFFLLQSKTFYYYSCFINLKFLSFTTANRIVIYISCSLHDAINSPIIWFPRLHIQCQKSYISRSSSTCPFQPGISLPPGLARRMDSIPAVSHASIIK